MTDWSFVSDNHAPASPEILDALREANVGDEPAYGADGWSQRLSVRLREVFETDLFWLPTPSGSAANGLALAACCPPYGAVLAHQEAHIRSTELATPEYLIGGGRIHPLPGRGGKIDPAALTAHLDSLPNPTEPHRRVMPAFALSVTQSTEAGGVYGLDHLATLATSARARGLATHMDGARFANALVSLDATPAAMTWKAGIDLLSFGATKNGALDAEAILCFDADVGRRLPFLHNSGGYLSSKGRFRAAQLLAYLEDDLWLINARRANRAAQALAGAINRLPGATLVAPVEANEVFVRLSARAEAGLADQSFSFRPWSRPLGDPDEAQCEGKVFRLVASYATSEELLSRFDAACQAVAARGSEPGSGR